MCFKPKMSVTRFRHRLLCVCIWVLVLGVLTIEATGSASEEVIEEVTKDRIDIPEANKESEIPATAESIDEAAIDTTTTVETPGFTIVEVPKDAESAAEPPEATNVETTKPLPYISTHANPAASSSASLVQLSPSDQFQKHVLSNLPSCPTHPEANFEHSDDRCDRNYENRRERRDERVHRHHQFLQDFASSQIPDERSWICPAEIPLEVLVKDRVGHETQWIVHNQSSGPIVLTYVDPITQQEVSAMDGHTYPPQTDGNAVIQPNHWVSVRVFQGQYFHAREILQTNITSVHGRAENDVHTAITLGRLLLRHRPGLIDIRNRMGGDSWSCPASAFRDPDPNTRMLRPEFSQSTPRVPLERCNVMHKGFVNRVGCPVDLYYAGSDDADRTSSRAATSSTLEGNSGNTQECSISADTGMTTCTDVITPAEHAAKVGVPTCHEQFKMHLGINLSTPNYLDDWSSPMKFEGTYLGHKFVARLRHDPRIVVDEIVIAKDIVRDCGLDALEIASGSSTVPEPVVPRLWEGAADLNRTDTTI